MENQSSIPPAPPAEIDVLNRALALLQRLILEKAKAASGTRYKSLADQEKDQTVYDCAAAIVPVVETRLYKAPLSMMHDVLDRLCCLEYIGDLTDPQLDQVGAILAAASVARMPWLYPPGEQQRARPSSSTGPGPNQAPDQAPDQSAGISRAGDAAVKGPDVADVGPIKLECASCLEVTDQGLTPDREPGGTHIRRVGRDRAKACGFWRPLAQVLQ